jgi:uncharacterized cupin superfamily protein
MSEERSYLVPAANRGEEIRFQHPLNPNSEIHGHQLGRLAGLQRTGVNLIRLPAGKESFLYHSHATEEEWLYVLSGRAIAEIGDREYEVGPGDFMGFPAPSVAHHLRNPFAEECVYLCGGENHELEVAEYPRLGLRLIRRPEGAEVVHLTDLKPVG